MKKGLVSIIIPTYNRKDVIGDAIDSCLSQTYQNIEIIVCDDHSTDGTQEYIVERMKEEVRIKYCVNPDGKKGANAARNTAIKIAQGEYLAYLDSDDLLLHDSIEVRAKILEENPNVAMVYGNVFCEIGKKREKWIYTDIEKENLDQRKYLMQELSLCIQSSIMARMSVFRHIGLLNEDQKAWTDDGFVVAVGMRYRVLHSGKFVAVFRKSAVSMTSNKWNGYFGCKFMVENYKRQIIQYASYGRYLLWKVRLCSGYCFAKEMEKPLDSVERKYWEFLHKNIKKIWRPFFRNHFE